jgi:hypothetical protein
MRFAMGYLAARLGKDQPTAQDRDELIARFVEALSDRVDPQAIYLFGSILSPDFTYASDIDAAVIFADANQAKKASAKIFAPPCLVDWPYDVLIYSAQEFAKKAEIGGICQVIKETGRRMR